MFDKAFLSSVILVAHSELADECLLQGSLWKHEPYRALDKILF